MPRCCSLGTPSPEEERNRGGEQVSMSGRRMRVDERDVIVTCICISYVHLGIHFPITHS